MIFDINLDSYPKALDADVRITLLLINKYIILQIKGEKGEKGINGRDGLPGLAPNGDAQYKSFPGPPGKLVKLFYFAILSDFVFAGTLKLYN